MATLLHRLGKTAYRRWPVFLLAWLVAFVAVGTFAATMAKPMRLSHIYVYIYMCIYTHTSIYIYIRTFIVTCMHI